MLNRCLSLGALALLLTAVGCSSTTKTNFTISLNNAGREPVTVWLAKSGGPDENEWLPPEAFVDSRAANIGTVKGIVIPPGKTGSIGPITGRFEPDAFAVLRVYAGELTLDQIMATPAGKLRVDVPLQEGANNLRVAPLLPLHVDHIDGPTTK